MILDIPVIPLSSSEIEHLLHWNLNENYIWISKATHFYNEGVYENDIMLLLPPISRKKSKLFLMTLQAEILWEDHDIHLLGYTFRIQSVKLSQALELFVSSASVLDVLLLMACTRKLNCVDCGFLSCISPGQFQECCVDALECIS